jgi:hypothetical protein
MSVKPKAPNIQMMLGDPSVPLEHRKRLLQHVCTQEGPEAGAVLESILAAAARQNGEEVCAKKARELADLIQQLQDGPLRQATFVHLLAGQGAAPRARVILPDGTPAFTTVPDEDLAILLNCGDTVLLDAGGKALLYRDPQGTDTGEEGHLERRLGADRVEVTIHDHERCILRVSASLREKLDSGEAAAGCTLLICPRRQLAFDALPSADGVSHYRYLVKDTPPDVQVARDIGDPPPYIEDLVEHVRTEMTDPDLGRRYRLRRVALKLLVGVSGSGKTLSILGFWRRMYELISEITGVDLADLPPRVLRLRAAEVLSKWLGESDKQIDRFFDEVDQLAGEPFVAPDGRQYELPVLAICEECDGLARTRGEDAVYDRIQTTLLQRLDVTCQKLKDRLVIFLFTTNVPHVVDPAFLRRAGGTTERFGRLTRRSFLAVLGKHLRGLPIQSINGEDRTEGFRRVAANLAAWLFSPNGQDRGQVELTYVGSSQPVLKYRADFLTGALVDRAVQEAATAARRAERLRQGRPGLSTALLAASFDRQIRAIADQLHSHNVTNYLDLPDGVRVASIRRIPQPAILPVELERHGSS